MAIADLIDDWRAKYRAKLYNQGYDDARNGRPRRMEAASGDRPSPDSATPFRPRRRSLRRRALRRRS